MPLMPPSVEHRTKRWREQRWLLDAVIKTLGPEWDQNRLSYVMAPCGVGAMPDFNAIRAGITKFNDMGRAYFRAAERREAMATECESQGDAVGARESYFIAAVIYGAAMWPIFANTPANVECDRRKQVCYAAYARYADHPVRRVEVPLSGGASVPGWLHLPRNAERSVPCVLATDGMDGFKEMLVSMYGDPLLERGIGVLALDGPGQGECTVQNLYITATNFIDAGRAALDWLCMQPEIDAPQLAIRSVSMGSLWGTQLAAADTRLCAAAVAYVAHEPGLYTAFEMASPSFKLRFMYMSGHEDEEAFDEFARSITAKGLGKSIRCPFLCVAGEDDDLSAISYTYDLLNDITAPKRLVLFEGERHSLHTAPSSFNGPNELDLAAQWLRDRFDGKEMTSEQWTINRTGAIAREPWGADRRGYLYEFKGGE